MFYFHRAKSFHANDRPGPDGPAAIQRMVLNGITRPLVMGIIGLG
jgi:hypothetical protein